ncbi:MAG: TonB-dependent receptor [Proteobacteria bacterium]|nr:TonB-dependent receptor [Pseudomonadota bacterium]
MRHRRISTRPLLAGSLLLAAPVFADVAADTGSAGGAHTNSNDTLQTVIVTATKRAERIKEVPMSITALTGADLQRSQATQFTDFAAQVPGLSLQALNPAQTRLVLRGLNVGGSGATVATVVDDMPFSMSGSQSNGQFFGADIDTFDLNRVEVLKGPQGTLYGATAEGGIIKYVTNAPDPSGFAAAGVIGGSTVDGGQTEGVIKGMVNLPFWDNKAALRLTGMRQGIPGYIDNSASGIRDVNRGPKYSVRGSLLLHPVDDFSARLTVFDQQVRLRDTNQVDVVGAAADPANPPANQFQRLDGYRTRAAVPEAQSVHLRYYALNLQYDMPLATLTNLTSYGTINNFQVVNLTDSNLAPGVTYGLALGGVYGMPIGVAEVQTQYVHKLNEELRLSSRPGNKLLGYDLDWLAGVFFTREATVLDQPIDAYGLPGLNVLQPPLGGGNIPADYKEKAGFFDATVHFSRAFDVSAGLRYSHTDQDSQVQLQCCVLFGPSMNFPYLYTSEHSTTWQVAPRWHLDDNNMLYARYSTGYRPGGPNLPLPSLPNPPGFKPDSTRNYELGLKSDLLNHRLSFDIALYKIDWTAVQIISYVSTPAGPVGINGNAGKARNIGVEWDLAWLPLPGLKLEALGSWMNAKSTTDAPGLGAMNGDKLPYVPDFSVTVNADYSWYAFRDYSMFVGSSWNYTGTRYTDFSVSPALSGHVKLPGYDALKLHVGLDNGRYSAELYGANLTNSLGLLTYANMGGANQAGLATFITPRTIGIELGAKF